MGTKKRLKHLENVIWPARRVGKFPNAFISFDSRGRILIEAFNNNVCFDRRTARLVARRINQALDAWNE